MASDLPLTPPFQDARHPRRKEVRFVAQRHHGIHRRGFQGGFVIACLLLAARDIAFQALGAKPSETKKRLRPQSCRQKTFLAGTVSCSSPSGPLRCYWNNFGVNSIK
jgi:hypothetical protein